MNLSTTRIFFCFVFLLTLTSCAKYTINYAQLGRAAKGAVDKNKKTFVVLNNGDTLQNENLKVKYHFINVATFFSKKKKINEKEMFSFQSKEGFVLNKNSISHLPLFRIRYGKINVYYTQTDDSRFTSGSYGSNGRYNVGTTGGTHTTFYFEKEKGKYEIMLNLENVKAAVSENPNALNLFNKYYPKFSSKTWISYKEILKVIDKYNKG
jgi:hypothetical protein